MKGKSKLLSTLIILFAIILSPLFVGCKTKARLATPNVVNFQTSADGRQLLVTDDNIFASGYRFGITTIENSATNDYIKFSSTTNCLDVTNIFQDATTYYFYAQALGGGDYLNSELSEISSYTIVSKLSAPKITLNDTTISWLAITNAQNYSIWAEYNDTTSLVTTQTATTYDGVATYSADKDGAVTFYVRCNEIKDATTSAVLYLGSADSNTVTYTANLQLAVPENLKVSDSDGTLSWSEVEHCDCYEVVINDSKPVECTTTSMAKSEYYTGLGEYTFKVRAKGTQNYISSQYCSVYQKTYSEKLITPKDFVYYDSDDSIMLRWSPVLNAQSYGIIIDGVEVVLNSGTGVASAITTSSITFTLGNLSSYGIYDSATFDSATVYVYAKGYGYYESSANSAEPVYRGTIDNVLASPNIVDETAKSRISWDLIDSASGYTVFVQDSNAITEITEGLLTDSLKAYFSYSQIVSTAGEYSFCVKANAADSDNDSNLSNVITKQVYQKLATPTINNVYVDGSNFCIDFDSISNAQSYTLYINDAVFLEQYTGSQDLNIQTIISQNSSATSFSFRLKCNAVDYYTESDTSSKFTVQKQLSTPTNLKISNGTLTWTSVKNAQGYVLMLDDKSFNLNSTTCSVNLQNYVPSLETRQVSVQAVCNGLDDSSLSNALYFNYISAFVSGCTDHYFYYGKTYDYYITSQDELNILVRYIVDNFLTETNVYMISYDATKTFSTRLKTAIDNLPVTFSFLSYGFDTSVASAYYSGTTKIEIDFAPVSSAPSTAAYSAAATKFENCAIYKTSNPRSDDYDNFVSDSFIVSQNVYSSDGLVSALVNQAKPNFMTENSTAEDVYNKAKQILRSICDDDMTDYQKALAIHDYLTDNISYDNYDYNLSKSATSMYLGFYHLAESALLYNLAVCDGYAKSFAILCNMEGIQTIVIGGAVNSGGHAWNKVYIDANGDGIKEWLVVDCTYDDPIVSKTNTQYTIHSYFLISDSEMESRTEDIDYPESTATDCSYYDRQKINGVSCTVTSLTQYNAIDNYISNVKQNSQSVVVEFIVKLSVYNAHYFTSTKVAFAFDLDEYYNLVIAYC